MANKNLKIAQLSPGVTIGFEYRIRQRIENKDEGEDFISIKASTPIPLFYPLTDRHKINKAEAKSNASKAMVQEIFIDLNSQWKGETANQKMLSRAFYKHRTEVLPGYLGAYKAQMGSLAGGRLSLLQVLDTYRMYLNASIEEGRLYRDLQISRLKLNYLRYHHPVATANVRSKKEHTND